MYLKAGQLLSIITLATVLISCNQDKPYSFIVAGHVYGGVGKVNHGVHPPFKEKFEELKLDKQLEFGVFTGDIVKECSEENWDGIDSDVRALGIPIYFAVGNHDVKNRTLYESRYGKTYYSFTEHGDLFVVLDGNLSGWNIEGDQLQFLKNAISENVRAKNIFIFVHQIIWWWGGDKKYAKLKLNSKENRSKELTYWTSVHPLLVNTQKNVFLFAGDIGAAKWSDNFMYGEEDNVRFIVSGMGDRHGDNIVKVSVLDTTVTIAMLLLQEDREMIINPDTFMIY